MPRRLSVLLHCNAVLCNNSTQGLQVDLISSTQIIGILLSRALHRLCIISERLMCTKGLYSNSIPCNYDVSEARELERGEPCIFIFTLWVSTSFSPVSVDSENFWYKFLFPRLESNAIRVTCR